MLRVRMNCSVILCTFNRCQSLVKALESVAASELPDSVTWEVLVVDNNSTDSTRVVAEEFSRRHPNRFRYLFEPQQGKSHALNTAIREARGDILVFTDDDVIVEPTWLRNLTVALESNEWVGAGGRIRAEQGFSFPSWLSLDGPYAMGGVVGLFDRGDKPAELDWAPYGANMAFRREMFERYGGFRTDMGPRPGSEIRGEDIDYGYRLMAAGERLRYEPSAIVYHKMPVDRISKDRFLAWWFGFGRSAARKWGRGPNILGIPRRYLSILKTATSTVVAILPLWLLASEAQQRFFYKALVWRKAGEIYEFYRLARSKDIK